MCGCAVGKGIVLVIAKLLSSYEARILCCEYISNARRIKIFCTLLESKLHDYEGEDF
jgi:hypothetical protein